MDENFEVQDSCGNVFEDLGTAVPEEDLVKSELVLKIIRIVNRRSLKQSQVARILGIPQPKVSSLLNGKLYGFSIDKILMFLTKLDRDINIVVKRKDPSHEYGRITVTSPPAITDQSPQTLDA